MRVDGAAIASASQEELVQVGLHLGPLLARHGRQPQQPPRSPWETRLTLHERPPSAIAFQIRSRTRCRSRAVRSPLGVTV